MIKMGWAGTVLKYIVVTGFIIAFWEIVSWLLTIIFSIPTGQVVIGNQTLTIDFGIQPDPDWASWKQWMAYGWNLLPIMAFIGNTLWLIAKSQEKDVAEVYEPMMPL